MVKDGAIHPAPCLVLLKPGRSSSPLIYISGVSNRYEGLALLTTIVEGGGNCNPASDPLPNQSMLSTSLINKILHLIDALDLPCRRSYIALDQGLVHLHEVLRVGSRLSCTTQTNGKLRI